MQDSQQTKDRAKHFFGSWAGSYDRSLLNFFLFEPSCFVFLEELVRFQQDHAQPFDVLDIGCGTGTLLDLMRSSNLQVGQLAGLDYTMEMCVLARSKCRNVESSQFPSILHADSERLPFADASFDVITCGHSFHHYPRQAAVVREFRRVLRSGGRLMLIDGFRDNAVGWVVYDVIIASIEKSVHHASWSLMRKYFQEAGLVDVTHRKFNFWFPAFLTMGTVPGGSA